jgi:tetratricopeptide (TPR) repeat protein
VGKEAVMGLSEMSVRSCFLLFGWSIIQICFPAIAAAQACDPWAGKAVSVQGAVQVLKFGQTAWAPVALDDVLCFGDTVHTDENSRAAFILPNEGLLRLDQETSLRFPEPENQTRSLIDLIRGVTHFFSRTPRSLKVLTPFVNGNVEGTEFLVDANAQQTHLLVFKGKVNAENNYGSLMVIDGQSVKARANAAPVYKTVVQPRDAVQWALYYPPIIDVQTVVLPEFDNAEQNNILREALAAYQRGETTMALKVLAELPEKWNIPDLLTYRAGLRLSVGRVEGAGDDIEKALQFESAHTHALALNALIAVVQNKKAEALELAIKASDLDPADIAAKIALSYAHQANFEIEGALEEMQNAVNLAPANALAWARLSELYLSVKELDKALEAARKAETLNPHIARTQTVLGFAYLAQIETDEARQAFESAIHMDQTAPLPRLGLGLAIIRDGNLKEGRQQIEIAAGLDPNNSLIRSYLGKAFYDEKRDSLSDGQLQIAKILDPLDPTPWYYDAIRKQSINRPVEALHDLRKSIELNDNRAVFRSQLLLDQDLAVRSASLGRIYNDLGFQKLGLSEGWKSLNSDPGNYSAHRLIADSYAALPRHEIARVSEQLQAQLRQPLTLSPIQPHLAESNLSIYENMGPATTTFNEFTPLFTRNRAALSATGVVGGNSTWSDEIALSGLWGKYALSVGQFHYETDGFRENNDLERNIYTAFFQAAPSTKTSIQGEIRATDFEYGDPVLRFNSDQFSPVVRQTVDIASYHLGFHHLFTPTSDFIGYLVYQDAEDRYVIPGIEFEGERNELMAEIQYMQNFEGFDIITGVNHSRTDADDTVWDEFDLRYTNVYLYSQIQYPNTFMWTVGASGDFFKDELYNIEREQFNPKLGLTWTLTPHTTIRAAGFRMLRRNIISDQTTEPTQIAGFNQFFDDFVNSDVWRYGLGIDRTFSPTVFGGAEVSRRNIDLPSLDYITDPENPTATFNEFDEDLARAYLYWTPLNWLSTRAEFIYEMFETDPLGYYSDLKSYKLPLGINFSFASGISAGLTATYVYQEGVFDDPDFEPGSTQDDDFWTVDCNISYRLPKRYGKISLHAKNLLDEQFRYQDTDYTNPRLYPEQLILAKLTLSF